MYIIFPCFSLFCLGVATKEDTYSSRPFNTRLLSKIHRNARVSPYWACTHPAGTAIPQNLVPGIGRYKGGSWETQQSTSEKNRKTTWSWNRKVGYTQILKGTFDADPARTMAIRHSGSTTGRGWSGHHRSSNKIHGDTPGTLWRMCKTYGCVSGFVRPPTYGSSSFLLVVLLVNRPECQPESTPDPEPEKGRWMLREMIFFIGDCHLGLPFGKLT